MSDGCQMKPRADKGAEYPSRCSQVHNRAVL